MTVGLGRALAAGAVGAVVVTLADELGRRVVPASPAARRLARDAGHVVEAHEVATT